MQCSLHEMYAAIVAIRPALSEADLRPETHLVDDLGLDSLGRVQLAEELKQRCNCELPDSVLQHGCRIAELLEGPPYTPETQAPALPGVLCEPSSPPFWSRVAGVLRGLWFLLLASGAAISLLFPISPLLRRSFTSRLARLFFIGAGVRVIVRGEAPAAPSHVFVSNHQSYIDAIVLHAMLPVRTVFVAKGEFRSSPIMRRMLMALGTEFVERWRVRESVRDLQSIGNQLAGHSVLFFPEGTFDGLSDLLPLKRGAFLVAALAHVPVVPIVIKGTRTVLPPGSWLLRRGMIEIRIHPAVHSTGGTWEAAEALYLKTRHVWEAELCGADRASAGRLD